MPRRSSTIKHFITYNLNYKVIAFLITLLLWLLVIGRDNKIESRELPVNVIVPDDHYVSYIEPETITIKLRGHPKLMKRYLLRTKDIKFKLDKITKKRLRLDISEDKLGIPPGVRLVSLSPQFIIVHIEKIDSSEK